MKKIILMSVLSIFMLFTSACNVDLPESRTFIVTDRKSFERIFVDDFLEFEIDFDSEMLIVYTFATHYVLPAKIANIELKEKILTVHYNIELNPGAGSAREKYQRWLIVKLDKQDITTVKNSVSEVYKDAEEDSTAEVLAYNAKLFDKCPDCAWINENFQTKNRLKGIIYD